MIYLDNNATTRTDPEVLAAMVACSENFYANPSSLHTPGQQARLSIDEARRQVARLINARPDEIVFTSGGTEADNLAILGSAQAMKGRRMGILTSPIEHQAVLNPCRHLMQLGHTVSNLSVDRSGAIPPESIAQAALGDFQFVSVMSANNETGVIQPIPEIVGMAKERKALVHTDAAQAAGRIPLDVRALNIDLLTLSAHKFHGPKGIGALFVRRGTPLAPILFGGHHERHLRPGTENVPAIVGFGKACEIALADLGKTSRYLCGLRDRFEQELRQNLPDIFINGETSYRLPNTSNLSVPGINGEMLCMNLDLLGVAISTGSACQAADDAPSHVLTAMGGTEEEARGAIRVSLSRYTTLEEIDQAVRFICQVVGTLR